MYPGLNTKNDRLFKAQAPVIVVMPQSDHGRAAAQRIAAALQKHGVQTELVDCSSGGLPEKATGSVVAVGNLADSAVVRDLYFRFLCATDLWYPGPGGYELRVLTNPFGNGHDGVLVGYSDAAGAAAGAGRIESALSANGVLPQADLHATRLPLTEEHAREIRAAKLKPEEISMNRGTTVADWKGYLYYLTGEAELGREYREVWRRYLTLPPAHLTSLNKFLPFMLIEPMGLFPEDERAAISRYIWDWAEGPEGVGVVEKTLNLNIGPNTPRHNHDLIPALALVYVSEYFKSRLPDRPEPAAWRRLANREYAHYCSSWKDFCDGLCHNWYLSQPMITHYGLIDPEHRFYKEGGARAAAECAIAIVNNAGWMPSAGDSDLHRQFPGPTLRTAAAWFGDGRYRFVHDFAPQHRRLSKKQAAPLLRAFDNGVVPVEPGDHVGITVIPVDPAWYNIRFSYPPEVAKFVDQSPQGVPLEKCFDKIAVRAGWKRDDDYFLLDGLSGGAHSGNDACGILDYSRFGVSGLVGSALKGSLNTDLVIVRNAEAHATLEFARLEAHECDAQGNAYLRVTLPGYGNADWTREIFLRRGACLVVCDTITAHEDGDYSVETIFRAPYQARLEGRTLRWEGRTAEGVAVQFKLESLAVAETETTAIIRTQAIWSQNEANRSVWEERYNNKDYAITEYRTSAVGKLRGGSVLRFAHLAQIRGPGEPELRLVTEGGKLVVLGGERPCELRDWPEARDAFVTPKTARVNLAALSVKPLFNAEAPITCLQPVKDGLLLGTEGGEVMRLGADHNLLWRMRLPDAVRTVAESGAESGSESLVLAGFGARGIWLGTETGATVKQFEFTYRETAWPWCQSQQAGVVGAVGLQRGKETCFVVGTGDNYIHLYDREGRELWHKLFSSLGAPGYLRVVRYGKSDTLRILAAPRLNSHRPDMQLLDDSGDFMATLPLAARLTGALSAFEMGGQSGRVFVICGAQKDPSLQIFDLARLDDLSSYPITVHIPETAPAMDARRFMGCRMWDRSLGGGVTGVAFDAEAGRIFAATDLGFVVGYDLEGQRLWHRLLPKPLIGLTRAGGFLIAADRAGVLSGLTVDGKDAAGGNCPGLTQIMLGADGAPLGIAGNVLLRMAI